MFEYLMPWLWMRHHPGTITERSATGAVIAQQRYAGLKGLPWGISESACWESNGKFGYGPFGIPSLSLRQIPNNKLVTAPCASLLAAQVDQARAIENLRRMEELGWSGRYGFYEAVDHSQPGRKVIRCWMAHHQGMGVLAICNVLFGNIFQQYFHAEPQVTATELLLQERLALEDCN